MDDSDTHAALSWFAAGFFAGSQRTESPPSEIAYQPSRSDKQTALEAAQRALQDHKLGACLGCRREGVVILDGFFCERCAPGISEMIDNE